MSNLVTINNNFKTSTVINSDTFDPQFFLDNFIVHGSVKGLLDNVASEFAGSAQRTFTVTGPYGSGKSTFAQYMTCLLSDDADIRDRALTPLSSGLVSKNLPYTDGWTCIKHLCDLKSPTHEITRSIVSGLDGDTSTIDDLDDAGCISLLKQIFADVDQTKDGVLILIDELGKALDYMASRGQDLHFFQSLADIVQEATNIVVIGFLHQSFSAYVGDKNVKTQSMWSKVQGRYKDFSFNPSTEESLHLIGKSFITDDAFNNGLSSDEHSLATIELAVNEFNIGDQQMFDNVLPLDPLVALLLGPISKQSFSQNERSLFSFIASHEKHGFRGFAENITEVTNISSIPLYRANMLWDYMYANIGHNIQASSEGQKWKEVVNSISRAENLGNDLSTLITKMVGLVTLVGVTSKLKISKEFIVSYITLMPEFDYSTDDVNAVIEELEELSIIIYRPTINSYQTFEVSDVDVNRLISDWRDKISNGIDWTKYINSNKSVLTTAHYHTKGVMRYADTHIVDVRDQLVLPIHGNIINFASIIIPTTTELFDGLVTEFSNNDRVMIGKPLHMKELKNACLELATLHTIIDQQKDLLYRNKPVKEEIEDREKFAAKKVQDTINRILEETGITYMQKPLDNKTLTSKVSHVADLLFSDCPAVPNELINRIKISSGPKSPLVKLVFAMEEFGSDPDLGFSPDTCPAEKGIFLSCVKSKGLHTPTMTPTFCGAWDVDTDVNDLPENEQGTYTVWKSGVDMVMNATDVVSMQDIIDHWMATPIGMTEGLSKVYGFALIKSLEENLAFYEFDSSKQWMYIGDIDESIVMHSVNTPTSVGVKYFNATVGNSNMVKNVALATGSDTNNFILDVAKSLTTKMHSLPEWVKKTTGGNLFNASGNPFLTKQTKWLRDSVLAASDPHLLLNEVVPKIFTDPKTMVNDLTICIDSLIDIDEMVTNEFKQLIFQILGTTNLANIEVRSIHITENAFKPDVAELAARLAKWSNNPNEKNFDRVMIHVVGVRKDAWNDMKITDGYNELFVMLKNFVQYEQFSVSKHIGTGSTFTTLIQTGVGATQVNETRSYNVNDISIVDVVAKKKIEEILKTLNKEDRIKILASISSDEMK